MQSTGEYAETLDNGEARDLKAGLLRFAHRSAVAPAGEPHVIIKN